MNYWTLGIGAIMILGAFGSMTGGDNDDSNLGLLLLIMGIVTLSVGFGAVDISKFAKYLPF